MNLNELSNHSFSIKEMLDKITLGSQILDVILIISLGLFFIVLTIFLVKNKIARNIIIVVICMLFFIFFIYSSDSKNNETDHDSDIYNNINSYESLKKIN